MAMTRVLFPTGSLWLFFQVVGAASGPNLGVFPTLATPYLGESWPTGAPCAGETPLTACLVGLKPILPAPVPIKGPGSYTQPRIWVGID